MAEEDDFELVYEPAPDRKALVAKIKEDLDWEDPDTPQPTFGPPIQDSMVHPEWRQHIEDEIKRQTAWIADFNAARSKDDQLVLY